ncbi:MAG: GGDEF domain-containing protein, partial [Acidimicrobiia bacterium]
AIERLWPAARAWGLSDDDLLTYWSDFRVAARRTNQQMGLDVGPQVDQLIVAAKQDYLASSVHAMSELDDARREIDELRAENERLEGLSLTDALTEAPNRAAFVAHLRAALAGLARTNAEGLVAVALFDLDYFKNVNDSQGHLVGDQLLRAVSAAALEAARVNELFARLGGDEFAMVLRPASLEELQRAVERLRAAMTAAIHTVPGAEQATVSAGAALLPRMGGELDATQTALIAAADDALYAAKRQGRNRAVVTNSLATGLVTGDLSQN